MLSFFTRDVLDEIWDLMSQFLRVFLPTLASVQKQPLRRKSRLQQTTILNIFYCFSEEIRLEAARQKIHMKYQALFSSKSNIYIHCKSFSHFFNKNIGIY